MNKLFTKIATLSVGLAMAIGVGVAVGANNAKGVDAAVVADTKYTYTFETITDFSSWGTSYSAHSSNGVYSDNGEGPAFDLSFASANHQASGVTDSPVTKGGAFTAVLSNGVPSGLEISTITFYGKAWAKKAQTIRMYYTTNGTTYTAISGATASSTSSSAAGDAMTISNVDFSSYSGAVGFKIDGSSTSNQVGYYGFDIVFAESTSTKKDVTLNVSGSSQMNLGDSQTLTVTAEDDEGPVEGLTYSFSSSDESIATIDNSGEINALLDGTTSITITSEATDDYNAGSYVFNLEVVDPDALTVVTFSGSATDPSATNVYTTTWSYTYDAHTYTVSNFSNNNWAWSYIKCGRKNYDSTGTITSDLFEEPINKVTLTVDSVNSGNLTSAKLYMASDADFTSDVEEFSYSISSAGRHAVSIPDNKIAENRYYKLEFVCTSAANNGVVQLSAVKFSASLLKDSIIEDNYHRESPFAITVGNSSTFMFYEVDGETRNRIYDDLSWTLADETVGSLTLNASECYVEGLKAGTTTLTCSAPGYKAYVATINVAEDPSLPEMEVWDTAKVPENTGLYYSSTANIYKFTARNVEDTSVVVDDAVWESSDTTVATVTSNAGQCSLTTVKPGEFDLTATSSSYQSVTIHLEVVKGYLEELNYDGTPSKTEYSDSENWSTDGVTITATYHSGWTEDVTSQVEWTFDPAEPEEGVTAVTFTASFGGESVTTSAFSVTVVHHHAGTAADPFNVAEGIAKAVEIGNVTGGKGPWVTTGKVSQVVQVLTTGYQNARFYITEDGKTTSPSLYAYDCKYLENAGFTEETAAEMVVGATVTITGNLLNYNNNTPEYARGCYLLDIQQPETGDITVTFDPTTSFEIGATGTFTATADDAEATLTWSVDDASVISVDSSTGAYEALGLGVARVTVTATHGDKQGTAFADIVVNGNEYIGVGDANAIAASLPSGKTSDYYVYVEGYVAEFATSQKDGNPRALDIVNFDEDSRIMVYTNVDPYASFVDGLHRGDYIKVKAHVQNYNGTYELTSPEKIDSSLSAMSIAFELLAETDAVCADYDGVTDNKEALEAIWETLSSASWYGALTGNEQSVLQEADASETSTTIQKAMARYDYLVGKYKLDNFISGRTPVVFANQPIQTSNNSVNTNFAMIAVIVVAVASLSAIGVLLVVKKRKYHN